MMLKNKTLIKIFSFIYKKHLENWWDEKSAKVIFITGWRNALIETPSGYRSRISFCFLWLK